MKKFCIIITIGGLLLMLYGCPDDYFSSRCPRCIHEYPINIKNLHSIIKTTDTLWVENDFDMRLCLDKGIFEGGVLTETPNFMKLEKDDWVAYIIPEIIGYDKKWENKYGTFYSADTKEKDGRYKSRYGLVFPDTGIYMIYGFGGLLEKTADECIGLLYYFDTNNFHLLSKELQLRYYGYAEKPYYHYFIKVVE